MTDNNRDVTYRFAYVFTSVNGNGWGSFFATIPGGLMTESWFKECEKFLKEQNPEMLPTILSWQAFDPDPTED